MKEKKMRREEIKRTALEFRKQGMPYSMLGKRLAKLGLKNKFGRKYSNAGIYQLVNNWEKNNTIISGPSKLTLADWATQLEKDEEVRKITPGEIAPIKPEPRRINRLDLLKDVMESGLNVDTRMFILSVLKEHFDRLGWKD